MGALAGIVKPSTGANCYVSLSTADDRRSAGTPAYPGILAPEAIDGSPPRSSARRRRQRTSQRRALVERREAVLAGRSFALGRVQSSKLIRWRVVDNTLQGKFAVIAGP